MSGLKDRRCYKGELLSIFIENRKILKGVDIDKILDLCPGFS
jgi:hypothetical protein